MFFSVRKGTDSEGREAAVLACRAKQGDRDAKQVFKADGSPATNKDGHTVWQIEYDYIEGLITGMEEKVVAMKGQDRRFLNVSVKGKNTSMVLSLEFGDRYWVDFCNRLLGVDLTKPTYLRPWAIADKDTGKMNYVFMLKQGGQKIEKRWNKANNYGNDADGKGGLPQGVQFDNPKTGKKDWAFLERDNWLQATVVARVAQELAAMNHNGEFREPVSNAYEGSLDLTRGEGVGASELNDQLDQAFSGVDEGDAPY